MPAPRKAGQRTEYRNERSGLAYPGNLLHLEKKSEAGDGQVFASLDGEARLLVGALPNDKGQTPAVYQQYIVRQSYGARLQRVKED